MNKADVIDPEAPHGRDNEGVPLAPYGHKIDGTPKLSRRGNAGGANSPKRKDNTRPLKSASGAPTRSDKQRREMLLQLNETFIVMPLAGASMVPPVIERIGQKRADGLAANAYVMANAGPEIADGLIILSQSKPGLLGFLDTVEEKAPWMALAMVGIKVVRALAQNMVAPNLQQAQAAREFVGMRTREAQAEMDRMEEEYYAEAETATPATEFSDAA